jgi:hypothetical protein
MVLVGGFLVGGNAGGSLAAFGAGMLAETAGELTRRAMGS